MKKVSKSNPLKTFNDNKDMAYKKAGGAMSDYKKYLKKANDGMSVTDPPVSTGTQGPSAAKDFVPASSGNLPLTGPTVSYSRTNLPFVNAGTIGLNGPIGQAAADAINRQMRRDSAAGRDVKAPFQRRGGSTKTKMAKGGATSFGMLSVKAGIDKNPKPTAADRIAGAKKKNKRK